MQAGGRRDSIAEWFGQGYCCDSVLICPAMFVGNGMSMAGLKKLVRWPCCNDLTELN